jgi:hypothetical protein
VKAFLGILIVLGSACSQSTTVPAEYRAALKTVCDGIDAYRMAASLQGSGPIVGQTLEMEDARMLAATAFKDWVNLEVPDIGVVREPVEAFRAVDFDLTQRSPELLTKCRSLEALLGLP